MLRRTLFAAVACLALSVPLQAIAGSDPRLSQDQRIDAILKDLRPKAPAPSGGATSPASPGAVTPRTLQEEMAAHHVPAVSIAVIDGGRVVWARAYGLADVASGRKATPRTLFQAASMSKPVAATAALALVQEGRLALDEDVNRRLTSWRLPYGGKAAGKVVTLRELLNHTGGLSVSWYDGYEPGAPLPTDVQILDGAPPAHSPPVVVSHEPGAEWRYSGGGYMLAQVLMADAAKQSFPELMRARVLVPAGMSASTYEQPLPADKRPLAATGYRIDGAAMPHGYHVYPEMAAAGLWTTPSDLARWMLAIQDAYAGRSAKIISQATAAAMLTPAQGEWGLGVEVQGQGDGLLFTHGGSNQGYKGMFLGYARGGRGVVVMTNGDGGGPVAIELVAAVIRAYGWPEQPPAPK
ncbi:MAG: serine hydrolase [Caulobacteraceae bacterium]|nr:serine hydrolase [Caulobacteraceae bacterium]